MLFRQKNTDPEQVALSLQKGISALVTLQQSDGSFPLLKRVRFRPWHVCHPLFSTVSVLLSAGSLLPKKTVSRAVEYIRHWRRDDGTWEFDPELGIPPDSDDTACALIVLARYSSNIINNSDAELLRSFWRTDGGPFRTWQADGIWSRRDRDDPVVNCNVLLALNELGVQPTNSEKAAVYRLIENSQDGCRYYCSPVTIGYAALRAGLEIKLLPLQVTNRPKSKRHILPIAQWLSIIQQWDKDMVSNILAAQSNDGYWLTENWFRAEGEPPPVWGCRAISTALCIEALNKVSNQ